MKWFVICIVGGVNEKNGIGKKNVCVDDWTAEGVIIASNDEKIEN